MQEDCRRAMQIVEEGRDIPQDLAKKLFEQGGCVVMQGLPKGAEFGIDCKSFHIGNKFMGAKMIPQGVHYIYVRHSKNAPRISFFHNFHAGDIIHRMWNQETEDFEEPHIPDEEQRYRLWLNVRNIDKNLGVYDFATYHQWVTLSTYISQNVLDRLNPENQGSFIYAQVDASTMEDLVDQSRPEGTQSYKIVDRQHPTRLRFADDQGLPKMIEKPDMKVRFSEVPTVTYEDTQKKRSGIDASDRFARLLDHSEGDRSFLGEFQYAFLTFLIGEVYEGYEHWKKLVHLVCGCQKMMESRSDLFSTLLATIHFQLKTAEDDFFSNELSKGNFLLCTLSNLFANIDDLPDSTCLDLKRRAKKFKKITEDRFELKFDIEEEFPTIVEIREVALKLIEPDID
ncbi:hypothetical protein L596_029704 [Steinernema carpocapsae]|uniref:Protein AAR2 homolog n=1 Tax=Steinernema carpocapsae TaxID=34508 RepID=A0A4U5LQK0_STECR|nr:hypothetical protein L596_029704 [Steinernema carpocapsae]